MNVCQNGKIKYYQKQQADTQSGPGHKKYFNKLPVSYFLFWPADYLENSRLILKFKAKHFEDKKRKNRDDENHTQNKIISKPIY